MARTTRTTKPTPRAVAPLRTTTEYTCEREDGVSVALAVYPGAEWGEAEDVAWVTITTPGGGSDRRAVVALPVSALDDLGAAVARVVAQYRAARGPRVA